MDSQNLDDRPMTTREMVYNVLVDLIDTETLVVISLLVLALYMLYKVTTGNESVELMKVFGPLLGLIIGAFAGFVKGLKKGVRIGEQKKQEGKVEP